MKFVKATTKDLNALMAFEKKNFKRPEDRFKRSSLYHLMTVPTSLTLLAKDTNGQIIGEVIGLLRHFKIPSGRVYKIGVDKEVRQKGIGTKLLHEIERWFKKMGMKKSCAEVRVKNKASQRMFEKNGYVKTAILPHYYANGENGIKYWRDL